jgi:rod shape-determining protein MreD
MPEANMARRRNPLLAILLSLFLALVLTVLPLPLTLSYWRPEFITMVLIFWVFNAPNFIGIWSAFFLGLLLDVLFETPFGVHALVLSVLAYLTRLSLRWVTVFSVSQTSGLVFVFVLAGLIIKRVLLGIVAVGPNSLWYWLPALTSALVWPTVMVSLRRFSQR